LSEGVGVDGVECADVAYAERMSSTKTCVWRLRLRMAGASDWACGPKWAPRNGLVDEWSGSASEDEDEGRDGATKKVWGVQRECLDERGWDGASLEGGERPDEVGGVVEGVVVEARTDG